MGKSFDDGHAEKVSAKLNLVRIMQQSAQRCEYVMIAAVVVEFDFADQLQPNALMFNLVSGLFELDVDLWKQTRMRRETS